MQWIEIQGNQEVPITFSTSNLKNQRTCSISVVSNRFLPCSAFLGARAVPYLMILRFIRRTIPAETFCRTAMTSGSSPISRRPWMARALAWGMAWGISTRSERDKGWITAVWSAIDENEKIEQF